MSDQYNLVSALPLLQDYPCFCTPLFINRESNNLWQQDQINGEILNFLPVTPPQTELLKPVDNIVREVGSNCIFAFQDTHKNILLGERGSIKELLIDRVDTLEEYPRILRSVGKFIDDDRIVKQAEFLIAEQERNKISHYTLDTLEITSDNEICGFLTDHFSSQERAFHASMRELSTEQSNDYKEINAKYRKALDRIKTNDQERAMRRMLELILITCSLKEEFQDIKIYVRIVYAIIAWKRFFDKNNRINNISGNNALDFFAIKIRDKGQFYNLFLRYVKSEKSEILENLSYVLMQYNTCLGNAAPQVTSTLFGKVEAINDTFGSLLINIDNTKVVQIPNRSEPNLWSARDCSQRTKHDEIVAVSMRQEGDNSGSRRGSKFVEEVLDVFFPLIKKSIDRNIDVHMGASNCYTVLVCRSIEKSRILKNGGIFVTQLEKILGLARLIITTGGILSQQDIKYNSDTLNSSMKNCVNDIHRDLKVEQFNAIDKTANIRIPINGLNSLDYRKMKTFMSLIQKIFPDFVFTLYYGINEENIKLLEKSEYKNSKELDCDELIELDRFGT